MQTTQELETIKSLPELLEGLSAGDEVIVTKNQKRVAKIIAESPEPPRKQRPEPGFWKGNITIISEDEEHLRGFPGYPE